MTERIVCGQLKLCQPKQKNHQNSDGFFVCGGGYQITGANPHEYLIVACCIFSVTPKVTPAAIAFPLLVIMPLLLVHRV